MTARKILLAGFAVSAGATALAGSQTVRVLITPDDLVHDAVFKEKQKKVIVEATTVDPYSLTHEKITSLPPAKVIWNAKGSGKLITYTGVSSLKAKYTWTVAWLYGRVTGPGEGEGEEPGEPPRYMINALETAVTIEWFFIFIDRLDYIYYVEWMSNGLCGLPGSNVDLKLTVDGVLTDSDSRPSIWYNPYIGSWASPIRRFSDLKFKKKTATLTATYTPNPATATDTKRKKIFVAP